MAHLVVEGSLVYLQVQCCLQVLLFLAPAKVWMFENSSLSDLVVSEVQTFLILPIPGFQAVPVFVGCPHHLAGQRSVRLNCLKLEVNMCLHSEMNKETVLFYVQCSVSGHRFLSF